MHFFLKKRLGILPCIIALIFVVIAILSLILAAVLWGDRTGVGDGKTIVGTEDPNDGGTTEPPEAGGTGQCTATVVRKDAPYTNQSTITVPIWRYTGANSAPRQSTKSLTVHRNCTTAVYNIFKKIYDDPSKPPIDVGDTGCMAHRPNPAKSNHPYGIACDVNWDENWCAPNCYHKTGYRVGRFWKPGNISPDNTYAAWVSGFDIRSIPINSPINSAFKSEKWARGLYSAGFDDMMHFSVNGR